MNAPTVEKIQANGYGSTIAETEVKQKRRQFSASYKLQILEEADAARHGEIGAILRREGLYSSHLENWRKLRDDGKLNEKQHRGRKPTKTMAEKALEKSEKENAKLREQLRRANLIIEAQKKLAQLLDNEQ